MTADIKEWDEEPPQPPVAKSTMRLPQRPGGGDGEAPADDAPAPADAAAEPTLFFGSVDEFVRERLRYTYSRRVGPQGPNFLFERVHGRGSGTAPFGRLNRRSEPAGSR